eukprot:3984760-Prymnesium_polylepis.1
MRLRLRLGLWLLRRTGQSECGQLRSQLTKPARARFVASAIFWLQSKHVEPVLYERDSIVMVTLE